MCRAKAPSRNRPRRPFHLASATTCDTHAPSWRSAPPASRLVSGSSAGVDQLLVEPKLVEVVAQIVMVPHIVRDLSTLLGLGRAFQRASKRRSTCTDAVAGGRNASTRNARKSPSTSIPTFAVSVAKCHVEVDSELQKRRSGMWTVAMGLPGAVATSDAVIKTTRMGTFTPGNRWRISH